MASQSPIVPAGPWHICQEPPSESPYTRNASLVSAAEMELSGLRMDRVKAMFRHAWEGYVKCALGRDEVRPGSCESLDWLHMGITVVDSLGAYISMYMEY